MSCVCARVSRLPSSIISRRISSRTSISYCFSTSIHTLPFQSEASSARTSLACFSTRPSHRTCYELVARPFRSPAFALSSRMPPYCRHGCKLMAVPRGFFRGFLAVDTEAACAAEAGRSLPLPSRPLKQTHGASPKGSTLPCTMQNATLGARGASHRVRSRMLSGGGACTVGRHTPGRGSAAAHEGEGTLLAAGPREARSY